MALSSADSWAPFDDTTGRLDLQPVLSAVLLKDTATLGLIGLGAPALDRTHYWNEDNLNAQTVTASESAEFSSSDLTLSVSDAARVRVGALLMDQAAGKVEILQVTAISTNDLTVVRGYASSSAETHAKDAIFTIVGMPVQAGDESITDISNSPTQRSNRVQTFKREVKIAGQEIAVSANGMRPGISSTFKHQLMKRMLEMKVEMNTSVLYSVVSAAPSDTVYASMQGLREWLVASGANSDSDAETLNEAVLNALYKSAWDDGGSPDQLLGPYKQLAQFSSAYKDRIRVAPSDRIVGMYVNKYLCDAGKEISFTLDRWFKVDEVALLDLNQGEGGGVYLAPLQGRELFTEPLAKIGDAIRAMLIADATLVVKNHTKVHAFHSALTVPA